MASGSTHVPLADRGRVFATAQHAQHLWTSAAHADAYQIGIAAFIVQNEQQGLVPKRSSTDLHAPHFCEAVLNGNGKVARLLCLDKHLGGKLCELRRGHASEDISIASVGHDAAI